MRLIKPIDKHEMLRRWSICEVYVDLFSDLDSLQLKETLHLLYSSDPEKESVAIKRALKEHHLSLINCIPEDTVWYLAALTICKKEFNQLRTLPVPDLAAVTNSTYKIPYGARLISENPVLNPRIAQLIKTLRKGKQYVQFSGITLLAKKTDGPFTIIEGNGRMISLYQVLFNEDRDLKFYNHELQVVLGLSAKDI